MNKFDKLVIKYFVLALPLLALIAILSMSNDVETLSAGEGIIRVIWDILGWILIAWIPCSLYLFIKMIVSEEFRNRTLKRFLKIQERDEREEIISGDAAKVSIISTCALMVLLIFLSTLSIQVGKLKGEELLKQDAKHYITIGFNPVSMNSIVETAKGEQQIFTYSGLPVPTPILLILIFIWQLVSFHRITRKRLES